MNENKGMAISFGGINTGLPSNLVDQLVDAERIPIKNLQEKKTQTESKLKHVNDLEDKIRAVSGSLKTLAGTRGFSDVVVNSGDPNVLTGTANPDVVKNGSWNVEVMQLAQKPGAMTNGFPDKDKAQMGVGYFSFDTAQGSKEVYIDGTNNTLEKAAAKINSTHAGIQASVVKDSSDKDNPFRLLITGLQVGEENRVAFPTLYFLDGDQDIYFDKERPAQNGKIKLDGFEIEVNKNKLDELIPGVTLDLKQAAPGKEVNITIGEDYKVVGGKIKSFVDTMNAVLAYVQSQSKLSEKTDTRSTLGGDSIIRRVQNDIRQLVQTPLYGVDGNITTLNQLGIVFNRSGTLDFSEEKFNGVLAAQVDDVRAFFVGDGFSTGFIPQVKAFVDRMVNNQFGPITNRKNGLQQQISQTDQRIEGMERNLSIKEQNLRKKFANLEETMSRLKSQGDQLAAKLGTGPGQSMNFGGASMTGGGQ